jgi:hypothetical protein
LFYLNFHIPLHSYRVADASNQVVQSSFEEFTHYSVKRFEEYLTGRPT